MKKKKFAFIAFFPVLPNLSGSSEVSFSFYKYWPNINKKLFFITHLKKINNTKIQTINILREGPFLKILYLLKSCLLIYKFLKKSKEPYLIIEGPSWILYSYITIKIIKFLLPKAVIIYHSHSIEYEIRKKFNNLLIEKITFFIEKLVLSLSDYKTSVSKLEQNKFKKYYGIDTILLPNGVDTSNFNKEKFKKKYKYIIYSGSYSYKPNKIAIDLLVKKIMPEILKKNSDVKLIITGGGYKNDINKKWLINYGKVKKKVMINLLRNSELTIIPLKFGSGTRIKIIEALCLGIPIITTSIGAQGILEKNKNFIIENNLNKFPYLANNIMRYKKLRISKKDKLFYQKKYSMKNIVKDFYSKNIEQ
jgi:glycosyltransferase involved in cell wall biosynthesis